MKTILIIAAVIFLTSAQDPNMRVFWGDRVQDKISRASLDGSGITTAVAEDVGAIHNLVAVPGDRVDNPPQLYWTDTEAGSIKTARGDNRGRVSDVLSDLLEPTSLQLFIDGDGEEWLYYAESGENGVIGRVKTDGTDQEIVQTVPDGYAPRVVEIDIADARLIYCYMKTPQDGGIAHIAFDTTTGTVSGSPTVVLSETGFPTDMTASELYNPREIIASNETDTFYYVDLFNVYKVVGGTPSEWLSDRSAAWFDAEPLGDTLYWTEGLNDKTMYASNSFEEASASDLLVVLPTGLGSSPAGLAFAPYNSAGLLSSSLMLLFTAAVAAIGAAMTDGAW